jgi:hypothetical protein
MSKPLYILAVGCLATLLPAFLFAQVDTLMRSWGTYYGGSSSDVVARMAIDADGNIYFVGTTSSTDTNVIATPGSYQSTNGGGSDGFIVKFNSSGMRVWGTYLGGTGNDGVEDIAMDRNGDIVIVGNTRSASGIATLGAHQQTYGGGDSYMGDGFIAKFDASGALIWSTYYGGSSHDACNTVAIDHANNIVVGGITDSPNNISTPGAHQITPGGSYDSFVAKFTAAGVWLWGTYYGGSSYDWYGWVTVDKSDNIILMGDTQGSAGAISTPGSFQPNYGGGSFDFFIVKFNSSGVRQWGTYYGGSGGDYDGFNLITDSSCNIYFTGNTNSTNGIATAGSFQPTYGGTRDGFLVKFDSTGTRQWGTYYGGTGEEDCGIKLVISRDNNYLYFAGRTYSDNNIASPRAYQSTRGGGFDAFVACFRTDGSRVWGTYYGGSGSDEGWGVALDSSGGIYVTGTTSSTSAMTANGFQNTYGGGTSDGYLAKFSNIVTGVEGRSADIPFTFLLAQNYPNPFNPSTTIEFALPKSAFVTLRVYDLLGGQVGERVNEKLSPGIYKTRWDATGLASGVYFYRLTAGEYAETKKLILLR